MHKSQAHSLASSGFSSTRSISLLVLFPPNLRPLDLRVFLSHHSHDSVAFSHADLRPTAKQGGGVAPQAARENASRSTPLQGPSQTPHFSPGLCSDSNLAGEVNPPLKPTESPCTGPLYSPKCRVPGGGGGVKLPGGNLCELPSLARGENINQ